MAHVRLLLALAVCLVSLVRGGVLPPRQATTSSLPPFVRSCHPAGTTCPEDCGYPQWFCRSQGCLGDAAGVCQYGTQKGCCCNQEWGWDAAPGWSTCPPASHTSTVVTSSSSSTSCSTTTTVTLPGSPVLPTSSSVYTDTTTASTYSFFRPGDPSATTASTASFFRPGDPSTTTNSNSVSTSTMDYSSPGAITIFTTSVTTITVSGSVITSTISTAFTKSGTTVQSASSSGSTLEQSTPSGVTSAPASSASLSSSSTEAWAIVTSTPLTVITLASPAATAATLTWFTPTTISFASPTDSLVTVSLPAWTFTSDAGNGPALFTTTPTTVISLPSLTPTVVTSSVPVPTVVSFSSPTDTLLTIPLPPVVTSTPESDAGGSSTASNPPGGSGDGSSTTTSTPVGGSGSPTQTNTSEGGGDGSSTPTSTPEGGGDGSSTATSPPGGSSPTASPGGSSPTPTASPTATDSATSSSAATSTTSPATTETSTTSITYTEQGYTLTAEWDVVELPEYHKLRGRKKKKKHRKSVGPPSWDLLDIFAGGLQFFRRLPPMPPVGYPPPPGPPPSNFGPVIDINPPRPPTPDPPSGPGTDPSEDAEDCPDPAPKCSSKRCAGDEDLEMCSLPPLDGCGCEPGECPETQPLCSDCDGRDGKCTSGDYEGCECAEECPEGIYTLECDDCGGAGSDWNICSGRRDLDPNKDGRYKGCKCTPFPPLGGFPKLSDPAITTDWMDHLALWQDDYSTDDKLPTCQQSLITAPQRASDNATLNVVDSISKFCSAHGPKTLTRPPNGTEPLLERQDIVSSMYAMSENQSFWLSANMVLDADPQIGCATYTTMATHECERMLTFAMEHCDPNSGVTHGASIKTDCIAYVSFIGSPERRARGQVVLDGRALTEEQNITLDHDPDQSPGFPPWSTEDRAWLTGKCDLDAHAEIRTSTWEPIYPAFCKYQSDPSRNFTMQDQVEFEYTSLQDPDPAPSRFGFRFVPNPGGVACHLTCSEAYDTLAKGSCGNFQNKGLMAPSGGIDVGCGRYYYTAQQPTGNEVRCLVDDYAYVGANESHPVKAATSWSQKHAYNAISFFCQGSWPTPMVASPDASHAPDGWRSQSPDYPERLYFFPETMQVITVSAAFASVVASANQHPSYPDFPTNEECNANPATRLVIPEVPDQPGDCIAAASAALGLCNIGQTDYFSGGYTIQHTNPHGCVIWKVYAYDTDVDTASVPPCVEDGTCTANMPPCVEEGTCSMVRPDGSLAQNATREEVAALIREYHPHLRGG